MNKKQAGKDKLDTFLRNLGVGKQDNAYTGLKNLGRDKEVAQIVSPYTEGYFRNSERYNKYKLKRKK